MRQWTLVCLAVSACANNVPQDRATGPDGRIKGAVPIVLADGEAKVKGIVTYPGGDRVDWKMIELPEGKKGRLDLSMTYSTPRPGLKVQFDVFDQWNVPVFEAAKHRNAQRSTTIDPAKGKYYIRISAPRRKDAAQYKLTAEFHEAVVVPGFDPTKLAISDPPKVPDVPEVAEVTAPPPTTTPPPITPPPPTTVTDPPKPPDPPPPPVVARVLKVSINGDMLDVTLGAGSETSKIGKDWKAIVTIGETGKDMPGGKAQIVQVNKTTTVIRIKMTPQQIGANPNVRLSPP